MNKISQAVLILWWLVGTASAAGTPQATDEAAKLQRLFEEEWEWTLQEYPEYATTVGDNRYNDKLTNLSAEAIARRKAHEREVLNRIRQIDRSRLSGQDIVSYDLFL